MPSMSLTDLVDVVSKAGSPKATKVSQIKHRAAYTPQTDFYKPLRAGLVHLHENNRPRADLAQLMAGIADAKKVKNYRSAVDGYRKWWGTKQLHWFSPPRATYTHAGIAVAINPELGLEIGGVRHIIKLYLKDESLTKLRVDLITCLMEHVLLPTAQPGDVVALLDVRRAKMFKVTANVALTRAIVDAELAYVASLWPTL